MSSNCNHHASNRIFQMNIALLKGKNMFIFVYEKKNEWTIELHINYNCYITNIIRRTKTVLLPNNHLIFIKSFILFLA